MSISSIWLCIVTILVSLPTNLAPCKAEDSWQVKIFETSRAGAKLKEQSQEHVTSANDSELPTIRILKEQRFQKLFGFGGAFTGSTAYVLNQLGTEKRKEVINAYFSPAGANYSLTRTHINSCDFSLDTYAYANTEGDINLEDFSIEPDLDDLVPLIQDALAVPGAEFKIIASPWTAPPWMKDNNEWYGGSLKSEFYPTWALYFSKYIQEYEKLGIPIWSVTVENEPLGNGAQWESMIYTPATMADFIKNHLGPRFHEDGIDTKILIYDQNRDHLKQWVTEILNDPDVAKFVYGTAVHWYSSTVEWYPEVLTEVHEAFPDKPLIETEGCIDAEIPHWQDDDWYWSKEATDWGYDWAPEEDKHLHPKYVPVYRYARDIIGGLNSWLSGWIDWNLVLDDKGGPNHAKNWCIAPVLVKPETKEVYYTPLYYVMAHFSKFIRPGAIRLGIDCEAKDLMVTACSNPNGSIAVVALNQTEKAVSYKLVCDNLHTTLTIPAEAIQTILLE